MLKPNIRPSTIDGIKRLAKQLKKDSGTRHAAALNASAIKAGYQNFAHAKNALVNQSRGRPYPLYLTRYWHDRDTHQIGRETLRIDLTIPLLDLCPKRDLHLLRGLGGRLVADDHIVSDRLNHSQWRAREEICKAARTLQFMEATGLQPSRDFDAAYPDGAHRSKLPGCDHVTEWIDPGTGQFILADEPYPKAHLSDERARWALTHNRHIRAAAWPGMYYPYATSLYIVTDASTGFDIDGLMTKIDRLPKPVIAEEWPGESAPDHSTFLSPMAKDANSVRRAKSKATIVCRPTKLTVPYGGAFGNQPRKPRAAMPLAAHIQAGSIIKAVLSSAEKPWSVNSRMDKIRSRLEDWMGVELGRNEPEGFDFFAV
ncbi:MAG: DUF5623 domain-containing protein, partial [Pseudomonadota bacterium]